MEDFLDSLWFKIMDLFHSIKDLLDMLFAPLNSLGPAVSIFVIAFITVVIAKILTKTIKTKRYKDLKKEFSYWYNLRQEAMKCEDREKARLLAKNIDQAELNRVYYDYFFEGFLLSLITKYLPILSAAAYVNEAYRAEALERLFGRNTIFKFATSGGGEIAIGGVFWFIISIVLIYLGWALTERMVKKRFMEKKPEVSSGTSSSVTSLS